MQAPNDRQPAPDRISISERIYELATRRARLSVCICIAVGVLSVDGSYAALIGLNENADSYFGHILPQLMLVMPMPVIIGGVIALLMTYGSHLVASAGVLTAIVLAGAATALAVLNLLAIDSWGGDMQALTIAFDFVALCAVALIASPVSYLWMRRRRQAAARDVVG